MFKSSLALWCLWNKLHQHMITCAFSQACMHGRLCRGPALSYMGCFCRGHSNLGPHNLGVLMAPSLTGSVTLGNLSLPCISWGLQCYLPIALLGGLREMLDRKPWALNKCDLLFIRTRNYRYCSKSLTIKTNLLLKMSFWTEQGQWSLLFCMREHTSSRLGILFQA